MDKKRLEKLKRLSKIKTVKSNLDPEPKIHRSPDDLYMRMDEYKPADPGEPISIGPDEIEPAPEDELVPIDPEKFNPPHLWELPLEKRPETEIMKKLNRYDPDREMKLDGKAAEKERRDEEAKEKEYVESHSPPLITHVSLCLTTACNLACTYCYRAKGKPVAMNENLGRMAVDFIMKKSGRDLSINFFGGEPLLEFNLMKKIIAHANKHAVVRGIKLRFSINTNGLLIDRQKMDYLKLNNIAVTLSMDGTPEIHNRFRVDRAGMGSYERLEEKLPIIMENPARVHARMTVTPDTVHEMFDGVKHIHDLGFRTLGIAIDRTSNNWNDENWNILKMQYNIILNWYMNLLRENASFYLVDLDYGAVSLKHPYPSQGLPCSAGITGLGISPQGRLYPCYRFVDLEGAEIGDIFNGFNIRAWRKYLDYSLDNLPKCRGCRLNFRCHRCPWLSYLRTRDITIPLEINCSEAELMTDLFREFDETMRNESNETYLKRSLEIENRYFKKKGGQHK